MTAGQRSRRLTARLVDLVADEGRCGPRWTWWFEADAPSGPMKLRTWTSRQVHPMSRARRYAMALLGPAARDDEPIDLTSLVGRECALTLEANDSGYLVIKDVVRPDEVLSI